MNKLSSVAKWTKEEVEHINQELKWYRSSHECEKEQRRLLWSYCNEMHKCIDRLEKEMKLLKDKARCENGIERRREISEHTHNRTQPSPSV